MTSNFEGTAKMKIRGQEALDAISKHFSAPVSDNLSIFLDILIFVMLILALSTFVYIFYIPGKSIKKAEEKKEKDIKKDAIKDIALMRGLSETERDSLFQLANTYELDPLKVFLKKQDFEELEAKVRNDIKRTVSLASIKRIKKNLF
ncbi:MAG: hypothetical protein GX221_10725 [Candidatus Riflebacteria bacterium]|nr:hypothetical protein [Candidatus Riflebacteria bacterium]